MPQPNQPSTKPGGIPFLMHLGFSLLTTYALLIILEAWRENLVRPFVNPDWLLWLAGLDLIITLILAGFKKKSCVVRSIIDQSKNT